MTDEPRRRFVDAERLVVLSKCQIVGTLVAHRPLLGLRSGKYRQLLVVAVGRGLGGYLPCRGRPVLE